MPILNTKKIPRCLSRKRAHFDPQSPHDSDIKFYHIDWKEHLKTRKDSVSVMQFIPTTFSSTSVITPMPSCPSTVWDIVSNLNLHVKKNLYEQLSKHKGNQIIKDIYLLTSRQSISTA